MPQFALSISLSVNRIIMYRILLNFVGTLNLTIYLLLTLYLLISFTKQTHSNPLPRSIIPTRSSSAPYCSLHVCTPSRRSEPVGGANKQTPRHIDSCVYWTPTQLFTLGVAWHTCGLLAHTHSLETIGPHSFKLLIGIGIVRLDN